MSDNAARTTGIARAAASAAQQARELQQAYERGFSSGWSAGVDWSASSAYEAGVNDTELELDEAMQRAYADGLLAGIASAPEYRAALDDSAAVIQDLKARLARYEGA